MISARTARIDDNLGRGTDGSNPLPSGGQSATNPRARSKTSCFRPDPRRLTATKLKPRHGGRGFRARLKRPRSRLRLPAEACRRHGAADAFKAGQHDAALRRTGRGALEFDLKRPEQSLKLVQRAVPQLAAGDGLRHPISPVCREAPTIRAFPAVT